MTYIIGGLAFIFILGAAVVIHEFGHFAVAKLLKIRVETFSVGFGPRLFGRKWGHTDYRVSAIPLGGYVKLGGDESNAPIEGAGDSDIPPEEQFNLRPKWQRIAVAVAGPVMNILTALAIPLGAAMLFGIPITPTSPVVARIAPGSAAEAAGLQPGDRIVSFNGVENPTWDRIRGDALVVPDQPQPIPMAIERSGARQQLSIVPKVRKEGTETVGDLGFLPDYGVVPVIIDRVQQGAAADRAQVKPGDRLLAIDGEQIRNSEQATQYIREFKGEQLRLTVEREGQQVEIASGVDRERDDKGNERVRLGVGLIDDPPRQRVGPVTATNYAVSFNLEILRLTGRALSQFFTGQRSARNTISGPIGIARAASTSANELGWGGVFGMLGFLSLSLGVFNLLPIPVLDGGAIFILLLEAVLGVVGIRLSMAIRERIQQVGFVMLLLLMVFVISNDLIKEASIWRGGSNKPAQQAPAPQK
ncbi:MAG TPA: RIP metalloprotease RseP [Pyrinomonadaceae bacterium]|nr:RIP metalloprotease RseP [Pyrinomonadaceae bacterium]